jgi:hypothetical protein
MMTTELLSDIEVVTVPRGTLCMELIILVILARIDTPIPTNVPWSVLSQQLAGSSLILGGLVRAISHSAMASIRKLFGNALHSFGVDDSADVGLILDINLIQHHVLLCCILAFLTRSINANVSVDTISWWKVADLGSHAARLLAQMVLISRPPHIITN